MPLFLHPCPHHGQILELCRILPEPEVVGRLHVTCELRSMWAMLLGPIEWRHGECSQAISHKPIGPDPACLNIQYCTSPWQHQHPALMITMQCNAATPLIVQSVGCIFEIARVLKINDHNLRRFLNKYYFNFCLDSSDNVQGICSGQKGFNYKNFWS